jgi:hypothetical protein
MIDKLKKTLIFLNIPKAGGTTLRRIIEKQFPRATCFRIYQDTKGPLEKFKSLSPLQKRRLRCVSGHMPFGIHRELPQPCCYITMLLHPVSRVIAQYYYMITHPRNYLYNIVTSRNMTLTEFTTSGIASELDNGQVRFISGKIFPELLDSFEPVDDEMLELVKDNIKILTNNV